MFKKHYINYVSVYIPGFARFREHIRSGQLPVGNGCNSTIEYMVADGRSTSRTRRGHEQRSIAKHNPLLNKSKGGEGRPAGR